MQWPTHSQITGVNLAVSVNCRAFWAPCSCTGVRVQEEARRQVRSRTKV